MPRRDLITIDGQSHYGLNVFNTVGIGGANNPGDVMTVQAMFRYLYENNFRKNFPMITWEGLDLELTGTADAKTLRAIRSYQRLHSYALISTDGVIHPAKYENRNIIHRINTRLMTITYLHLELWIADNSFDYTRDIARRFPNVAFWIK